MKKIFLVVMFVIICTAVVSCGENDANYTEIGNKDTEQAQNIATEGFSVVNELGGSVKELYISQSGMKEWGENLLGNTLLAKGVTVDISLSGAPLPTMVFDVAAIMEDGTEHQIKNIDVSVSKKVELKVKNGKAVANLK